MRKAPDSGDNVRVCYGDYQPIYVAIRVCSTYIPTLKFTKHLLFISNHQPQP